MKRIPWNKGIKGEEYKSHFKKGMSGTFEKGITPWNKEKKLSEETRLKISLSLIGRESWNTGMKVSGMSGKKHSKETLMKMSESQKTWIRSKRAPLSEETKRKISIANKGRRKRLIPIEDRKHAYDRDYKDWMLAVKNRDGWKCKMSNVDCSGRLEAHHILSYSEHAKLRYEINNGITLCVFHHPRKRSEEARLSPYFQSLLVNET